MKRGAVTLHGRDRWLYLGLILLGWLASLPVLANRVRAEGAVRNVELVADERSFVQLARGQGVSPAVFLGELHRLGVQGLGVSESSIASLQQDGLLTVLSGQYWQSQLAAVGAAPPPLAISPVGTYVLVPDPSLAQWIVGALRVELAGTPYSFQVASWSGQTVLQIPVPQAASVLVNLPLGFRPGAFALARSLGMDVVPRLQNTPWGLDATQVDALFQRITQAGVPIHTIVFAGTDTGVTGYPDALAVTAQWMRAHGYLLGAIENASQLGNLPQPGIAYLNAALGASTVRVYSVPDWLINIPSTDRVLISLFSGVEERNLRLVYLHPITTGRDPVAANLRFYEQFAAFLRSRGVPLGVPQGFPVVNVPTVSRILENLAVVGAALLLLESLFPGIRRFGYQPLAVLGVLAVGLSTASHTLSVQVGALGAAVSFGGLGAVYLARLWPRLRWPQRPTFGALWRRAVLTVLAMAAIAFLGGWFIGTLLGSTGFFLEWHYFRGVKLTFLAIPFIALLGFMAYAGFSPQGRGAVRDVWRETVWLGERSVKFKYLGAIAVVLAIGAYYLLRSGNVSSHLVPALELKERDLLARVFTYRPLEKEFLVGYPAAFLAVLAQWRRSRPWFLLLTLGGSVAMVSVIDAFATVRTPFVHTFLRETYGLALGLVTATAALAVFYAAVRLVDRWSVRSSADCPPTSERPGS